MRTPHQYCAFAIPLFSLTVWALLAKNPASGFVQKMPKCDVVGVASSGIIQVRFCAFFISLRGLSKPPAAFRCVFLPFFLSGESCTRNVLTFVNTTAIAYTQNSAFLPGSWHHAIVVLFTNVRTLRVRHRTWFNDSNVSRLLQVSPEALSTRTVL